MELRRKIALWICPELEHSIPAAGMEYKDALDRVVSKAISDAAELGGDKKTYIDQLLGRMAAYVQSNGLSEREFCRRVNSSEALFRNMRKGSLPSADTLSKILDEIGETVVLGRAISFEVEPIKTCLTLKNSVNSSPPRPKPTKKEAA